MAIYDYLCDNCGSAFEVERPMGFTGRVKCASCGSTRTAKVFAPAGVVFKGSGFYVTDSSGRSKATVSSTNGNGSAPSADKSQPSTTAAKPDAKD